MNQALLIFSVFGAISSLGYFVACAILGNDEEKLRDRLTTKRIDPVQGPRKKVAFVPILQQLGQAAAAPFMPKDREKQSTLRRMLARAGIYSPAAAKAVTGAKVICLCGGLVGGYAFGVTMDLVLFGVSIGGLVGYLLPTMWLRHAVSQNQQDLTFALPDALDLMVICVEAGLTIDASLQRVGDELVLAHPALSREFGIAHMETRVGLSRIEALKNLGQRTSNTALQSMAAMLAQADRFGTSVAQALRVHAESLRISRQHAADEIAGRASVKLTFPLVLFIFPATFIILAGPTIIGLMNSSLFKD